jgi:hypothetical protein
MLEGAKQEGTSDVAYSRNHPPVLKDNQEPANALSDPFEPEENSRILTVAGMRLPRSGPTILG